MRQPLRWQRRPDGGGDARTSRAVASSTIASRTRFASALPRRTPLAARRFPPASGARCCCSRASSRGLALHRSGDCTVVRGAGAVSRTFSASSSVNACDAGSFGRPGRVAERKVGEQQARHADVFDDVLGAAHHHRRDAVRFEQRARRGSSLWWQTGQFGTRIAASTRVGLAARDELGAIDLERDAMAAIGRHAVEARGNAADAARRCRARAAPAAGSSVPRSSAVVCLRSIATCAMRRSWSRAVSPE